MFTRRVTIRYRSEGKLLPCPMKWLDSFSMRNFTNDPVFDDTLPVADGTMELGQRVPLEQLRSAMEDWFKKKSYLAKGSELVISEAT